MREIFSFLIMPLTIFWELLICTVLLFVFKRKRASKYLFFISLFWLLAISTRFLPDLLVNNLEKQYTTLTVTDKIAESNPVFIMVLGGGFSDNTKLLPNDRLSDYSLCRLVEGIRLHRLIPGSKIVFSEDIPSSSGNQADLMELTAISLGVNNSSIEKIANARTTGEEASRFNSKFGKKGLVILVTGAVHMPRAMKLFRNEGLNPVASPTNHLVKYKKSEIAFSWLPTSKNILKMELAVHEYAGIAWNGLSFRKK